MGHSAAALIDPTDSVALAVTLETLLADAPRRDAMRQAGLARARDYSWERTAAATYAVVTEAASI